MFSRIMCCRRNITCCRVITLVSRHAGNAAYTVNEILLLNIGEVTHLSGINGSSHFFLCCTWYTSNDLIGCLGNKK